LFVFRYIINVTSSVKLGLTATFPLRPVEYLVDVHALPTTLVFVCTYCAQAHLGSGGFRMETTVTHLCDWVIVLAAIATDQVEVRPDFPIYFLP